MLRLSDGDIEDGRSGYRDAFGIAGNVCDESINGFAIDENIGSVYIAWVGVFINVPATHFASGIIDGFINGESGSSGVYGFKAVRMWVATFYVQNIFRVTPYDGGKEVFE